MSFLVSLGMLPFLVLQVIAAALLAGALITARRTGGKAPALIGGALVAVAICAVLAALAVVQEKTGRNLGVSGGIASDARGWIKQHPVRPVNRGDVGDNLRVLNDAVTFLRAHRDQLAAAHQAKIEELSRIPERPRRLLTVSEETQYLQTAQSAYDVIAELAGSTPSAQ